MKIHNAGLTGTIPSEIGLMRNLIEFSVHDNDLMRGSVPTELGLLRKLEVLSLASTLSGFVPPELCGIEVLEFHCGSLCGCSCPCLQGNDTGSVLQGLEFVNGSAAWNGTKRGGNQIV